MIPLTPLESGLWLQTASGYGLKGVTPLLNLFIKIYYVYNLLKYGDYEL